MPSATTGATSASAASYWRATCAAPSRRAPTTPASSAPLPAYHASDPVSRLEGLGILGDLAVLRRRCLGSCGRNNHFYLDEACIYACSRPDPKTGLKVGICMSAASQLRIMYLGAEWRRRNT